MQHCNGKAALRPHQRDQEKVFDLEEWEAARGPKWVDVVETASQLRAKDWQKKTWKKQCKARDSLDAKEKRVNKVLAALESAKQSSTATPAPVAADAGSEKPADRAPVETASQLRAKDWRKKTWKKQCKARDSLDAKEKRVNEVLAALKSAKRSSTATPAPVAADAGSEKPTDRAPSPPAAARKGAHNQKESRDGSKGDNLLSYILTISAKPSSPDHSDHESHRMLNYDYDAVILHSETIANSARDSWKTSDDFENASISVSCWNESPDSVSSGKKRKDRSGHPKLNQLAIDYLRSWLLSRQHIEQPYPSEQNYADLSRATGVEKPQLKNWFV